ncbi:hypothetical protein CsSME_00012620 [Camellia sinensis var. sinensis]
MSNSVVYLYVPFDRLRSLEDNLLSAWYTSTLPTRIKAKLCSSDWLECVNEPQFPSSFGGDPIAPFLPSNPNWIEELKLTLFESQHFAPNQALVSPTTQYEAENLLEEYEDFKNQDSEYGEDVNMGDTHGRGEMDEVKRALKQTMFEMKTQ